MHRPVPAWAPVALAISLALAAAPASAQSKGPAAKAPIANYWMDVATVNVSIPGVEEMADMPLIGGMMGNFFGGSKLGVVPGKWLDLALYTRLRSRPAPRALTPSRLGRRWARACPSSRWRSRSPAARRPSRAKTSSARSPRGGCSSTGAAARRCARDSRASSTWPPPGPWISRSSSSAATRPERGATSHPGRAIWPNDKDKQRVPKDASLVGEHAVSGEGVPPSLRFAIGEKQDFMERLNLAAAGDPKGPITASWNAVSTARAYFLSAIGGGGDDMILWSSSEVPEAGLGLMDYLANAQVDQWVKEKVLLPASTQQCAVPAGIFGNARGAMVRAIAYGNELNLVYPPRPTDLKLLAAWNPEWSLRVRVKSTSMTMLGQEAAQARQQKKEEPANPLDLLKKGIFGR